MGNFFEDLVEDAQEFGHDLVDAPQSALTHIEDGLADAQDKLQEGVTSAGDKVQGFFSDLGSETQQAFSSAGDKIGEGAQDIIDIGRTALSTLVSNIPGVQTTRTLLLIGAGVLGLFFIMRASK